MKVFSSLDCAFSKSQTFEHAHAINVKATTMFIEIIDFSRECVAMIKDKKLLEARDHLAFANED